MKQKRHLDEDFVKEIISNYLSPGHPIAFSSPYVVYNFYRDYISLSQAKSILNSIDPYTTHRDVKRPSVYNPFYSYNRRVNFQADLIDIINLHRANKFVKYLLVIIDVFTRKLWVIPLKRKDALSTANGFQVWLDVLKEEEKNDKKAIKARTLYVDRGKEFVNDKVISLLKENNVHIYFANRGESKAGIAERVNKTIQMKIYKYLHLTSRLNYIDQLPNFVNTYNNSQHRTLNKMTPNEADSEENEEFVRDMHNSRYLKVQKLKLKRRKKEEEFKKGDLVLVKLKKGKIGTATRGYTANFSNEIYVVIGVKSNLPIKMYVVKSLLTDNVLNSKLYSNELSRLNPRKFKVDKRLKVTIEDDIEYSFVTLRGLHKKFACWVPTSKIDKNKFIPAEYVSELKNVSF